MPLIEYYGLLFEWHDQKMELVYRGREIAFEEVCSIFLDPTMVSYDDVGATFRCVARRHSLWIYRKHSNCTDTDKSEPYLFQHFG